MNQRDDGLSAQAWTIMNTLPFWYGNPDLNTKKQKAGFIGSESTESPCTNSCPGGCLQLKGIFEFPVRVKTSFEEDFSSALTCWLCYSGRDSNHAYYCAAKRAYVGSYQMKTAHLPSFKWSSGDPRR